MPSLIFAVWAGIYQSYHFSSLSLIVQYNKLECSFLALQPSLIFVANVGIYQSGAHILLFHQQAILLS
jgi:hypothetical protein